MHPDDRAQVEREHRPRRSSQARDFSHEERILRPDGSVRHLQSVGEVIRDENGTRRSACSASASTSPSASRPKARCASPSRTIRLLLAGVRDYAIYMLDTDGHVRSWNDGAERIKGYNARRDRRPALPHVLYAEEDRANGLPERALATAAREGQFEAQGWRVRKDGSRFYASVVIDAIRNDAGELIGFAKITRDITAQHEAQLALERDARAARAGAEDGGARPAHRRHRA